MVPMMFKIGHAGVSPSTRGTTWQVKAVHSHDLGCIEFFFDAHRLQLHCVALPRPGGNQNGCQDR